ncbi:unnamed protein product [Effrenium voratum]|nr:unnamed protein product [Effrenium voratum]
MTEAPTGATDFATGRSEAAQRQAAQVVRHAKSGDAAEEPEAKAKGRVPRPPEPKEEDPYAFFVPAVVFFLYLGFGTIYSAEYFMPMGDVGGKIAVGFGVLFVLIVLGVTLKEVMQKKKSTSESESESDSDAESSSSSKPKKKSSKATKAVATKKASRKEAEEKKSKSKRKAKDDSSEDESEDENDEEEEDRNPTRRRSAAKARSDGGAEAEIGDGGMTAEEGSELPCQAIRCPMACQATCQCPMVHPRGALTQRSTPWGADLLETIARPAAPWTATSPGTGGAGTSGPSTGATTATG